MKDSQISVGGGRELAYTDIGDPGGRCVFFFHGAPMSRLHLVALDEEFAAQGLRVVAPERPGYGRSSPQPGRSMSDWAADVAALADELGIDHFVVAGHSSGGPYAVSCAALLAERVSAGVVLAGVTDMGWPGAWKGYPASEVELMRMADEEAAIARCVERYGADGQGFLTESDFEFPEPDNALLADEKAGAALMSALAEAFRQGVTGYAQDLIIQGRPWPFDPSGIRVPFDVIHGELDTLLPVAHSRHTAELIPGSTLRVLPGHGHLTTLSEMPAIVSGSARSPT